MANSTRYASRTPVVPLPAILVCLAFFILPVSAADAEIEAYMGDTITISGVSYIGDTMYLFLTGDGLDANGVTLTDMNGHADKGDFTVVDVNDDQTWSYRWDTSRVSRSIDPGVYTIYATTGPADLANLGGSGTYKTVEVWLKDPDAAARASSGATYTLNPEKRTTSTMQTLVFASPPPTPSPQPTIIPATETVATANITTAVPVTPQATAIPQSATMPLLSLFAVLGGMAIGLSFDRKYGKKEK